MAINSKQKGARGEREAVKYLKSLGFEDAKRTAQYNGLLGRGDVECPWSLPGVNIEVKYGYPASTFDVGSAQLRKACEQAKQDSGNSQWAVLWKPKGCRQWRLTVPWNVDYVTLAHDENITLELKSLREPGCNYETTNSEQLSTSAAFGGSGA